MKKLFLIAFALIFSANLMMAQNAKVASKPVQSDKPKQVPVKMASTPAATSNKQEATKPAPQNTKPKEATVNTTPPKPADNSKAQQAKPGMKKDGTPDKRYKQNQKLKKDGTPDKRFKQNKPTGNGK